MKLTERQESELEKKAESLKYIFKASNGMIFCNCPNKKNCARNSLSGGFVCPHLFEYRTILDTQERVKMGKNFLVTKHPEENGLRVFVVSSDVIIESRHPSFKHTIKGYIDFIRSKEIKSYKVLKFGVRESDIVSFFGSTLEEKKIKDHVIYSGYKDFTDFSEHNSWYKDRLNRKMKNHFVSADFLFINYLQIMSMFRYIGKNDFEKKVYDFVFFSEGKDDALKTIEELKFLNQSGFIDTKTFKTLDAMNASIQEFTFWADMFDMGASDDELNDILEKPEYIQIHESGSTVYLRNLMKYGYFPKETADYVLKDKSPGKIVNKLRAFQRYIILVNNFKLKEPKFPDDIYKAKSNVEMVVLNGLGKRMDTCISMIKTKFESELSGIFQSEKVYRQLYPLFPGSREDLVTMDLSSISLPDFIALNEVCFEIRNKEDPESSFILVNVDLKNHSKDTAHYKWKKEKVTEPFLTKLIDKSIRQIRDLSETLKYEPYIYETNQMYEVYK